MRIAVLGTGMVGRALAGRLDEVGHDVVVGTRDPAATLARTAPDAMGTPPYAQWQAEHPAIGLVPFGATGDVDLLVNATNGEASVGALTAAGVGERPGLVVVDVTNALDLSSMPPRSLAGTSDSLGEQVQRTFPQARIVRTLHTMNAEVMVHPELVPGAHTVFVCGDDADAKAVTTGLLRELGWPEASVLDLGGIETGRGTEMLMPLWLNLMGVLGTATFNLAVVRG